MDVPLLRTLTEKSTITFGKYGLSTVGHILNLRNFGYLRWLYYNVEGITFTNEVLEKIHIYPPDRINKPGKDPEKCGEQTKKMRAIRFTRYGALDYLKKKAHGEKEKRLDFIRKDKSRAKEYYKKSVLRTHNQK
jgi:hypothetical protein